MPDTILGVSKEALDRAEASAQRRLNWKKPEPSGAMIDAEAKRKEEAERQAHERHADYLRQRGWTWSEDIQAWSLTAIDTRWSRTEKLVVGGDFHSATASAWAEQKRLEAEELASKQRP